MADDITFDIPPGYLLSPTQVRLQLSERVTGLQYTVGGSAPAISKYIAYDGRTPANPFIAVTQDGKGNVVYDGGFPKIYNTQAPPASATSFNDLSPSFKYVFNALRFIENKTKRLMGNNKVLVIGDATGSYNVKGLTGSHFGTSLDRLAVAGGYALTLKNRLDWVGEKIDCTEEELDEYCCVFLMSSMNTVVKQITDRAIDALVAYRENGNGILIMTDHGPNVATLEDAKGTYATSYFTTANFLATRFGAWFSGNFSRSPVNVGYIRQNYGDHPLYNGLTDDENIYASTSESRVFVEPFEPILPDDVEPFEIGVGRTLIQVAAVLDTGEIVTYRAEYNVVDAKVSFTDGKVIRDNGQVLDVGLNNRTLIDVVIDSPDMSVFEGNEGIVSINDVRVGVVTWDAEGGTVFIWDDHDGGALLVNNGDRVGVVFATMGLESAITIRRFQPPITGQHSLAVVSTLLRPYKSQLTDIDRLKTLLSDIGDIVPWQRTEYTQNIPNTLEILENYFSNRADYIGYTEKVEDVRTILLSGTEEEWEFNENHGWYRNVQPDRSTWYSGEMLDTIYTAEQLSRLWRIQATFTGLLNQPNDGGVGYNVLSVELDDGSWRRIGTWDGWPNSKDGHKMFDGQSDDHLGRFNFVTHDVVNQMLFIEPPANRSIVRFWVTSQISHDRPPVTRGMKDIILFFRP